MTRLERILCLAAALYAPACANPPVTDGPHNIPEYMHGASLSSHESYGRLSVPENLRHSTRFEDWKASGKIRYAARHDAGTHQIHYWFQTADLDNPEKPRLSYMFNKRDYFDEFLLKVHGIFSESLAHTNRILEETILEYNIIVVPGLLDKYSEAIHGTNDIIINADRWLRSISGNGGKHNPCLSAAHEIYHIMNYQADPHENKFGREFSALLHETTVDINVRGIDDVKKRLKNLKNAYTGSYSIEALENEQDLRRILAIYAGLYICTDGTGSLAFGGLKKLEELVNRLLSDKEVGADSFNSVCWLMGIKLTVKWLLELVQQP